MSDICRKQCGNPDDKDMNGLNDDLEIHLEDASDYFAQAKQVYESIEIPAEYPEKIRKLIRQLSDG